MERIKLAQRIQAFEAPTASVPSVLPFGMTMDAFLAAVDRMSSDVNDAGFSIHCELPALDITMDQTLSEALYRLAEMDPKTSDDIVYNIMIGSFSEIPWEENHV